MIHCHIIYNFSPDPDRVRVEYLPDCENFASWLHNKITKYFHAKNDGTRWIYCDELTQEEAEYVEMLAKSQWGEEGYEVIGRAGEMDKQDKMKLVKPESEKVENKEPEVGQLSLF